MKETDILNLDNTAFVSLKGELAAAFLEYQAAATELEGKAKAFEQAKERAQRALSILTKLSVGKLVTGDGQTTPR